MNEHEVPAFRGGRNVAIKVPEHAFETTVAFYRDTLGLTLAYDAIGTKAFDFGPERDAWEAVFDDGTMLRLNALLMRLGTHVRTERRREIYEAAIPDLPKVGVRPLHDIVGDIPAARGRLAAEIDRLEAEIGST